MLWLHFWLHLHVPNLDISFREFGLPRSRRTTPADAHQRGSPIPYGIRGSQGLKARGESPAAMVLIS